MGQFFKEMFKLFGTPVLSFFGALVPSYTAYSQSSLQLEKEREFQEAEKEAREADMAYKWHKEILHMHREYAECIRLIYQYKDQHKNPSQDYTVAFPIELHGGKEVAERVNACRSLAQDYWTEILLFRDRHDEFVTEHKLYEVWKPRHALYLEVVSPLDMVLGYSDEELGRVQNPHLFENV